MTDLDQHVLRYWEREFPELHPSKNRGGRRTYTQEDVALILRIKTLLREDKYTIEGARQVLAQKQARTDDSVRALRHHLKEVRAFLSDLLERLPQQEQ